MENNNNEETPCCYLCLDDESGEELLCGICSCRGGSGYCHFSCLVKNGKVTLQSVVNDADFDEDILYRAWRKCSTCKQYWTSDVFDKMSDEFTEIVSTEFPDHVELKIAALRFKLDAAIANDRPMIELESISSELAKASHEVLDANSGEMTPCVCDGLYTAYMSLGDIAANRGDVTKTVEYYKKCRKLIEDVEEDGTWRMMEMDVGIACANAMIHGANAVSAWKATVLLLEEFYELTEQTYGKTSDMVLNAGDMLAKALHKSGQFIRSERKRITSYEIVRQLHGTQHPKTHYHKKNMDIAKQRIAYFSENESRLIEVFEYDAASDNYLLKCAKERDNAVFPVSASSSDIVFVKGTPAVCHGFVDGNKHLNGKLGELHDFDFNLCQYVIRFEKDNVQPIKIKAENFRIVFELPPKE